MAIIITGGHEEYQRLLDDMRALVRHELTQAQPATPAAASAADELLPLKQAAALLDISISTLHEHKRTGRICTTRIGGRVYIRRSDLLTAGTREQRTIKPARTKAQR